MTKRIGISIHGKFKGTPPDNNLPDGDYVYQTTGAGFGNVTWDESARQQIRRRVTPYNPRTSAQTARRNKFTDAVTAWQNLTESARNTWAKKAREKGRTPYNFFLSHYLKSH